MKSLLRSFFLVLLGFYLPACATVYQIQVNGYTDPQAPPALTPGASFFVIENKDAKNPLLEKEIAGKIQGLLGKQGYRLDAFEKAEYYLFFGYGIGQEKVTVAVPDYYPWGGGVGLGIGGGSWYRGGSSFVLAPFFGYGFPYGYVPETVYDRWLILNVVDGKHYRDKGEFRTLWVGEARSAGSSSDLRVVVNYLLVAAFREFGKNTGKALSVEIKEQAPEVQGLGQ